MIFKAAPTTTFVLVPHNTPFLLPSVFVGFNQNPFRAILVMKAMANTAHCRRVEKIQEMHDLLIALAFVGMVVAPAIVSARVDNSPLLEDGE
jgi:hypothetical protein